VTIKFLHQLIKFGLVGVINTLIGLGAIYVLMYFFSTNPFISNFIGYGMGALISFYLNKLWTFSDKKPITKVLPKYIFIIFVSYTFNLISIYLAISVLHINQYISQLLGICIYSIIMFLCLRFYVFAVNKQK